MRSTRLQQEPALLQAAKSGQVKIGAIFGGQGFNNLTCLDELAHLQRADGEVISDLVHRADVTLKELATTPHNSGFHDDFGFELTQWLSDPSSAPAREYLALAPISFPLNTLLSLAHYCIVCRRLSRTPGQFNAALTCVTGHSQGILAAAAVAKSDSWYSFWESADFALRLAFAIGLESHLANPPSSVSAVERQQSIEYGFGDPAPMLSIAGLTKAELAPIIQKTNDGLLDQDGKIHLALENSRHKHVAAGPVRALWKLCLFLDQVRAPEGLDQSRLLFNERKPTINMQFLPISAPFHSTYLDNVESRVVQYKFSTSLHDPKLALPIVHTHTAAHVRVESTRDLVGSLVRAVTVETVQWQAVCSSLNVTHVLSFGPGRIGELTLECIEGSGLCIINMTERDQRTSRIASQAEFYSCEMPPTTVNWKTRFGPRVTQGQANGTRHIQTNMTRIFGTPPVMVPGMVPTTIHPDFVGTIMRAGYHAELAGGGYSHKAKFERAIRDLAAQVPPHRGVTCNLLYANPQTIAWQVSCLRRLISEGVPVSGITIGAGIPSDDIVAEYIESVGLKHISFKPGSGPAIGRVLEIAQRYPHFPIGLQWTGGRAGGHHSSEDFHEVILKKYGQIRSCANVILIAGSGFGAGEDSFPYLSGEWSQAYGYPPMPFDGILFGSRMMGCKEAHTSPAVKRLIVETKGVSDAEWHHSYRSPVGGVVTITSEMGQPIHMLATRGVMLWRDLDEKVFSIRNSAERLQYLNAHHDDIVARLNKDFAKPWFALDTKGQSVRLEDMTYNVVLRRMCRLLFVRHQRRWIDDSYQRLVQDYVHLAAERFGRVTPDHSGDVDTIMQSFVMSLTSAADEVLYPQDVALLMALFRRRGQKPVPFVPALDEHFETWFKKDSLWQAEDLDAVMDLDVQRVCIIHGPVAARYSTSADESAIDILDKVCQQHAASLNSSVASSEPSYHLPAYGPQPFVDLGSFSGLKISDTDNARRYELSAKGALPKTEMLRQHIAGKSPWLRAGLVEDRTFGHVGWTENPVRAAFTPKPGDIIELQLSPEAAVKGVTLLSRHGQSTGLRKPVIRISLEDSRTVLAILSPQTALLEPVSVVLKYRLEQDNAGSRLYECRTDQHSAVQDMYRRLWIKNGSSPPSAGLNSEFCGGELTLTQVNVRRYEEVVRRVSPMQLPAWTPDMPLPLDFCVVVAWEALVGPLVIPDLQCDLLRLLHQSVDISQNPSAQLLNIGDVVHTVSRITGLSMTPSGKRIEVSAEVIRSEVAVVTIKTEFFIRGAPEGHRHQFNSTQEPEILFAVNTDVREAILLSRNWLHLDRSSENLQGSNLVFQLTSHSTYDLDGRVTSLQVAGKVCTLGRSNDLASLGTVYFEDDGDVGNIVMDFLSRHGTHRYPRLPLDRPGWIEDSTVYINAPVQSGSYAVVSTDHNPIHVCPVFARYAGLSGVVVHGMNTSAIVRRLLENAVGDLSRSRFRRWRVSFQDVVRPGDLLRVEFEHVAMERGAMVLQVQVFNDGSGDRVMNAEATVEQVSTAYLFCGQGSQEKGMGMELYDTSPDAKALWDRGDTFLRERFGFSILQIVRENPEHLLVSFGGMRGRRIRDNYLAMTRKTGSARGDGEEVCIVRDLTPISTSYIFSEKKGLLFSTQFSQPALALMEMAEYEHLRARGMVQVDSSFAGHSLGEYAALGACTSIMTLEDLLELVFYRGLKMQNALPRDANGRTDFAMMAVDPSRVGNGFNEQALNTVVRLIAEETKLLLEVVNYNVESQQYVCAGHFRSLHIMSQILNDLCKSKNGSLDLCDSRLRLTTRLHAVAAQSFTNDHVLERGKASIPLSGIDIPFHSTMLRDEISHYRKYLSERVRVGDVKPAELVKRWIPNVTGTPFSTDKSYIEQVYRTTGSEPLRCLIEAMA